MPCCLPTASTLPYFMGIYYLFQVSFQKLSFYSDCVHAVLLTLNNPVETLTSPGYPSNYTNDLMCFYHIKVSIRVQWQCDNNNNTMSSLVGNFLLL